MSLGVVSALAVLGIMGVVYMTNRRTRQDDRPHLEYSFDGSQVVFSRRSLGDVAPSLEYQGEEIDRLVAVRLTLRNLGANRIATDDFIMPPAIVADEMVTVLGTQGDTRSVCLDEPISHGRESFRFPFTFEELEGGASTTLDILASTGPRTNVWFEGRLASGRTSRRGSGSVDHVRGLSLRDASKREWEAPVISSFLALIWVAGMTPYLDWSLPFHLPEIFGTPVLEVTLKMIVGLLIVASPVLILEVRRRHENRALRSVYPEAEVEPASRLRR